MTDLSRERTSETKLASNISKTMRCAERIHVTNGKRLYPLVRLTTTRFPLMSATLTLTIHVCTNTPILLELDLMWVGALHPHLGGRIFQHKRCRSVIILSVVTLDFMRNVVMCYRPRLGRRRRHPKASCDRRNKQTGASGSQYLSDLLFIDSSLPMCYPPLRLLRLKSLESTYFLKTFSELAIRA